MKKLNTLNYDDILQNVTMAKYKQFTVTYSNSYVNLYYKGVCINTFMTHSKNISKIKTEIKNEIKKHDINELTKMSLDYLKTFLSSISIEKIISYNNLKNDKMNKINKILINDIKEYFIYRIINK